MEKDNVVNISGFKQFEDNIKIEDSIKDDMSEGMTPEEKELCGPMHMTSIEEDTEYNCSIEVVDGKTVIKRNKGYNRTPLYLRPKIASDEVAMEIL